MNLCEKHIIGRNTRERLVSCRVQFALASHEISLAGLSDAAFGFHFVRLRCVLSQVLVCYSGVGQVWIAGRWRSCSPGMAYLTPPAVPHAYKALRGKRWGICWVMYVESDNREPVVNLDTPILVETDPWPLQSAITGLYHESIGPADLGVMNCWLELVDVSVRRIVQSDRWENRLRHIWAMVDADLARPWSVEDISELADVSGEHLRRLCKRYIGRSPKRHLTHLRMRRAAGLLASTDRTIEDIARAVGYENPFAFSTAFKRSMGLPPSAWGIKTILP